MLSHFVSGHSSSIPSLVWDSADGPTDADRALHGDLVSYLPDQLLTKMDVSTMAHSLEARSPLLDTHLVEFAATIPASQLTRIPAHVYTVTGFRNLEKGMSPMQAALEAAARAHPDWIHGGWP